MLTVIRRRYENTERRAAAVAEKGIKYIGMGVSGGEEGARNGALALPCHNSLAHTVHLSVDICTCSLPFADHELRSVMADVLSCCSAYKGALLGMHAAVHQGHRVSSSTITKWLFLRCCRAQHDARRRQGGLQGTGANRQQGRCPGDSPVPLRAALLRRSYFDADPDCDPSIW